MYQFKELGGLTLITSVALWGFTAVKLLLGLSEVLGLGLALVGLSSTLLLVILLANAILFGCWTYRASANAHVIADGLSISAGWAVGWYFVPILCLYQPYVAMKETWLASHYGSNWGDAESSSLLPIWWGAWLVSGFIGYGTVFASQDPALAGDFTLASAVITVVATFALTRVMAQVQEGQRVMRHAEVFA